MSEEQIIEALNKSSDVIVKDTWGVLVGLIGSDLRRGTIEHSSTVKILVNVLYERCPEYTKHSLRMAACTHAQDLRVGAYPTKLWSRRFGDKN